MKVPYPKSLYYRENGTGRDTYISVDNGGYYLPHCTLPEFPVSSLRGVRRVRPVTANPSNKMLRYITDGTGRDTYIHGN